MFIDFGGRMRHVGTAKTAGWFYDVALWTRPAFGVIRGGGETDVYLGWISVGWYKRLEPHPLDNAVGTVRAFLSGAPPREYYLGATLRTRSGLRTLFKVNAPRWR